MPKKRLLPSSERIGTVNNNKEMRISKRQALVHFDVGGRVFRVLRETIERYPDSLLAKLLREFPDLGIQDDPVYVDRSPKAFEWILEIYRNGDYEMCRPEMSRNALTRELDFYQLPSLWDLELAVPNLGNDESAKLQKKLFELLFNKLEQDNLMDFLPVRVYFYRKDVSAGKDTQDRILIELDTNSEEVFDIDDDRDELDQWCCTDSYRPEDISGWEIMQHEMTHELFAVRDLSVVQPLTVMQQLARRCGLKLVAEGHNTNCEILIPFLKVTYLT